MFSICVNVFQYYLLSIDVDGVVVEPGVPDEAGPLVPTHGHAVAVVLVQVLAKIA